MKLAFCLFHYFPYGGLQRDFVRIAEEALARGHTIDVYTMHWEGPFIPNIDLTIVPIKKLQNHTKREDFVKKVLPQLAQKKYDVVVGFNKMPGLDIYFNADTCYQAKARLSKPWYYRLTGRYKSSVAYEKVIFAKDAKTHILLLSALQQSDFQTYYHTPAERFHLLPPGIAKDRIAPANAPQIRNAVRNQFHVKPEEYLLLMVGSGFKTKGLDRILVGFAALPDELKKRARIIVLGKDHQRPFEQLAKNLRIEKRLSFLGGRDDVPRFLLGADLLLHPAYNENTGTVLLEALASGLPVLTTDVCGYAHFIKDAKAGCVIASPYQQEEFNKTLVTMLSSSDYPIWQKNGIEFAKKNDIYNMPIKAVDIIESLNNKEI